ncbi:NAD(P)H-dependent oxidoreductase [Sulfitobacter sp. D35]|uniref:FMN-dependent NADH-azoreductase n=1 Tax=Sulfitobacter sp. D35 TaxID=3083252 RepID=UPI00296E5C7C|nr:NAD(P)H-dependent oxidoreductase [Sulfitobacter sp. D35]MDW4497305.1 NAD(P)H-dependent oxidoreductase [Sulfitobacter sp. D35]
MTSTVLHIDASARAEGSVSRRLSAEVAARFPGAEILRRDLAGGLPVLDAAWIGANVTPANGRTPSQREALALSDELVSELERADVVVIGLPIYNFGIPAALKTWVDLVARAGVTFRYTENGPEGLLTGKRAIVVLASGGTEVGSDIDFASGYLRHFLGFLGITAVEIIAADRLAVDADASVGQAHRRIEALAA